MYICKCKWTLKSKFNLMDIKSRNMEYDIKNNETLFVVVICYKNAISVIQPQD